MDRFEQIINIRKALKDAKIKQSFSKQTFQSKQVDLANYPWDECILDQTERYGDEETAKKVCGAIKAMNAREEMDITPNPCWENYEPIGLKPDGSPNCVPIKASKEAFVIPSPNSGEEEQAYISRCISDIIGEYDAEGQAYAVCKGKWDE